MPTSYATVAEVRAAGIANPPTDPVVQIALDVGKSLIDSLTDNAYIAAVTETRNFSDIRTPLVVIDEPFSAITAVTVAGFPLAAGNYQIEDWGLRLYPMMLQDASGFPLLHGWETPNYSTRDGFGYTVSVTATWGLASIPVNVQQANLLLALDYLAATATSSSGGTTYDSRVASLSVEGFSVSFRDSTGGSSSASQTTGNIMVDRLLGLPKARVGIA